MVGTIVNTGAIIIGTVAGSILKKGIKAKYQEALFNAMGFAAIALGINSIVNNLPNSVATRFYLLLAWLWVAWWGQC